MCVLLAVFPIQIYAQQVNDTLTISLAQTWQKAEEYSRKIAISKKATAIASTEILDAQRERLPDNLYKVGADLYMNIYNGNKLNLKIEEDKILHQLAGIREAETVSAIRYEVAAHYLDLQQALIFKELIIKDIADQEKQLKEIQYMLKL